MNLLIYFIQFLILILSGGWMLYSIGQIILPILGFEIRKSWAISFWSGLCFLLFYLIIWHFFLPISNATVILPAIASVIIAVREAGSFLNRRTFSKSLIAQISFFLILIAYFFKQSLDDQFSYDSLTYYFSSIRWYQQYPVIVGHANLFVYFGLNQSWFLLAALWEQFIPENGAFFLNGFFLCWFAWMNWVRLLSLLKSGGQSLRKTPIPLIGLLLAMKTIHISSPAPDIPVMIITLEIIWFLYPMVFCGRKSINRIALLIFLAVSFITVKLSMIGLVLGVLPLYLMAPVSANKIRRMLPLTLFLALFVLAWMFRGVLLSGYPLFPFRAIFVSVEWLAPEFVPKSLSDYILQFARIQQHGAILPEYSGLKWIPLWFKIYRFNASILIFFLSVLIFVASKFLNSFPKKFSLISLLPLFTGLIFWFSFAPDPRFAIGLFFGIAGLAFVLVMNRLYRYLPFNGKEILIIPVLGFFLWSNRNPAFPVSFPSDICCVKTVTRSGVPLYIPQNAHVGEWRIVNCPLPSTVLPFQNLKTGELLGRPYYYQDPTMNIY